MKTIGYFLCLNIVAKTTNNTYNNNIVVFATILKGGFIINSKDNHRKLGINVEIGRTISILHRQYKIYVKNRVKDYGLNHTQFRILMYLLNHNGVSQSEINKVFKFNKGFLAHQVKDLEAIGYIYKEKCQDDKRKHLLKVTDKTIGMEKEFYKLLSNYADVLGNDIKEEDKIHFFHLLEKMLDNVVKENEVYNETT